MTVLGACVICKAERFYGNLPQKTDRVHSKIHQQTPKYIQILVGQSNIINGTTRCQTSSPTTIAKRLLRLITGRAAPVHLATHLDLTN